MTGQWDGQPGAGRTLVVTNDFPPRRGGIESFVLSLTRRLPADRVVVHTSSTPGDRSYDSTLPFPVVRDPTRILLPTPRVARRVRQTMTGYGCDRVVFGAAAPLGLLAPSLRSAGARRIVGLTHGHEAWWARVPATRPPLHRIGEACDVLTYVSDWCRGMIASALSEEAAAAMQRLTPGVDATRFRPGCGGASVRADLGLRADRPVVVCAARMVTRKGHDVLLQAWPRVLDAVPDAVLMLVGDGPRRPVLERLVRAGGIAESVLFTGSVGWEQMPAHLDAGDVFAMPCRSRVFGLEREALGIVFLEAQACGLPVVVGDSGGAPEAVRHGESGWVVDPRDPVGVAARLIDLLVRPEQARAMGACGREWVRAEWSWSRAAEALEKALAGPSSSSESDPAG